MRPCHHLFCRGDFNAEEATNPETVEPRSRAVVDKWPYRPNGQPGWPSEAAESNVSGGNLTTNLGRRLTQPRLSPCHAGITDPGPSGGDVGRKAGKLRDVGSPRASSVSICCWANAPLQDSRPLWVRDKAT